MTRLFVDRVSASYGRAPALREISLDAGDGELLALLGPSGCGKTTLLKIIAGLLAPDAGDVRFDDRSQRDVPAERRGAAMVFQKPLLFPHLTVRENVGFGLKMRGRPRDESDRRVAEALRRVRLEGFEDRRPSQLSGGQEQRVAIARALVTEPRVLLLDEPFSALDESLRADLRRFVRALQQESRITTVFVTHDQAEAAAVADRIALLFDGRLEQLGPPRDFFLAPRTARAARFFGWHLIPGAPRDDRFETALGAFPLAPGEPAPAWLGFRPERLTVESSPAPFPAVVEAALDLGTRIRYGLRLPDDSFVEIETTAAAPAPPGARLALGLPPESIRFFGA